MSLQVLVKMEPTKLQILAEKAMDGDEEALAYLQFEDVNVVGPSHGKHSAGTITTARTFSLLRLSSIYIFCGAQRTCP